MKTLSDLKAELRAWHSSTSMLEYLWKEYPHLEQRALKLPTATHEEREGYTKALERCRDIQKLRIWRTEERGVYQLSLYKNEFRQAWVILHGSVDYLIEKLRIFQQAWGVNIYEHYNKKAQTRLNDALGVLSKQNKGLYIGAGRGVTVYRTNDAPNLGYITSYYTNSDVRKATKQAQLGTVIVVENPHPENSSYKWIPCQLGPPTATLATPSVFRPTRLYWIAQLLNIGGNEPIIPPTPVAVFDPFDL